MTTTLEAIGKSLATGRRLDEAEAEVVVETKDLLGLGALADDRRRLINGNRVTFVRVQKVQVDSDVSTDIEVLPGAGELRIVGDPKSETEALTTTRRVIDAAGDVPVTGFSLESLADVCAWNESALGGLLNNLKRSGLSLISEAQVERFDGPEWFELVKQTGLTVARLTVGNPGELSGVELARRVVGWGQHVDQVQAFAPLPQILGEEPTTGYGDVRQVALARLLVDNIESIQVDWSLYGPKLALESACLVFPERFYESRVGRFVR